MKYLLKQFLFHLGVLFTFSDVINEVHGAIPLPDNYPGRNCSISNITVKTNFDAAKYAGAWYEVGWLPLYFEAQYTPFIDYVEVYKEVANSNNFNVETYGRGQADDPKCVEKDRVLYYNDTSKYYFMANNGNDSVQVDYWIISTDYDHYSLTYGCSARSGDTCLAAHAWIWSRKTTLQSQYYAMTNSSLPQLCLIPSDLIVTDQLKECRESEPTDGSEPISYSLILLLLTTSISGTLLYS